MCTYSTSNMKKTKRDLNTNVFYWSFYHRCVFLVRGYVINPLKCISTPGLTYFKVYQVHDMLTHWGRDKMTTISQTTISNVFTWKKMVIFVSRFHWNLFPRDKLTIFLHWFRYRLGTVQATSHYLNQWWHILLTHIFVTRPQWVKQQPSSFIGSKDSPIT